MKAKVVHATIDPTRLPAAVEAVRLELGPQFLSCPGARHGYWMADPATGHLLAITVWDDDEHLRAAAAADGAQRASVAERIGLRILAVQSLDVIGAHEEPMSVEPHLRYVRATWVDGLVPGAEGSLPQLYREAVPDQARSRGFCASYWLGDLATGSGLGLSMWEGPAELSASEMTSRRRRRRFEELLSCRVGAVAEYQALGVAHRELGAVPAALGERPTPGFAATGTSARRAARVAHAARMRVTHRSAAARSAAPTWVDGAASVDGSASVDGNGSRGTADDDTLARRAAAVWEVSRRARIGTTIGCPPGALLAVRGDRSYQVVFLLDGHAAVVDHDVVLPVERGSLFGAQAIAQIRPTAKTVLATSPVQVHVFSRAEFGAVIDCLPSVAEELLTFDLDR